MPNLPWVEAIKAGAIAKLIRELRGATKSPAWDDTIAAADAELSRLLRAVEVLGEAVERVAAKECEHTRNKTRVCTEAGHPPIYWCNPCRARRALADVREG